MTRGIKNDRPHGPLKKWVYQALISAVLTLSFLGIFLYGGEKGIWLKKQVIRLTSPTSDLTPQIQGVLGLGGGSEKEPMVLPVSGIVVRDFGWYTQDTGKQGWHDGIDIKGAAGQTVKAAAAGKVEKTGGNNAEGWLVVIRHSRDLVTSYENLGTLSVSAGQTLRQGETIGRSGRNMVHFAIIFQGSPVSPLEYLRGNRDSL